MSKNKCLFLLVLFATLLFNSSSQSNDIKTYKSSGLVNESLEINYSAVMSEALKENSAEETIYPRVEIKDPEI